MILGPADGFRVTAEENWLTKISMAYINIAEWSSDQVVEWLKGEWMGEEWTVPKISSRKWFPLLRKKTRPWSLTLSFNCTLPCNININILSRNKELRKWRNSPAIHPISALDRDVSFHSFLPSSPPSIFAIIMLMYPINNARSLISLSLSLHLHLRPGQHVPLYGRLLE